MAIGGIDDAPSERLLARAQSSLGRLAAVEHRAIEFLRSSDEELRAATPGFYALDITDGQQPDDFTFELIDPRDDSRTGRVEFVAGEPKETGFDA